MTRHHPKHPEHKRPEPVSTSAWTYWLATFVVVMVLAFVMALHTTMRVHRSQSHVIAAPVANTIPVAPPLVWPVPSEPAEVDLSDLKASVDIPAQAPAVEAAPASDAPAVVAPAVEAPIAKAAPLASQAVAARHRARHHHHRRRHYRRHHASFVCLTPRPDGLEHDVIACITLDAARLGGLIQ